MMRALWCTAFLLSQSLAAKTFQNSYVAFDVPNDWSCLQEGVAWTCTPQSPSSAKEAIIVLAAKVAGPEDSLNGFLNYLKQPKNITTKMGATVPSHVSYAQDRVLSSHHWIQAQHLSSEIEDYYTLYLATVKNQLAILVSFSAEKNRIAYYNPIFDAAIKSLRIVAGNELLFPKTKVNNNSEVIGIVPQSTLTPAQAAPPPPVVEQKRGKALFGLALILLALLGGAYIFKTRRKNISHMKKPKNRSK